MKLVETYREATPPYYDNAGPWRLKMIDDSNKQSTSISFNEGEPEDMSFGRELSDVFNIANMVKAAYEAGKRGEELHYEYIEEKED